MPHEVLKQAEFAGEWWLPAADEGITKVAGHLVWNGQRGDLALHDAFTRTRGNIYGNEERRYATVHGETTTSEQVSVLRALGVGTNIGIGQAGFRESQRLASHWIVVGAHVTDETRYSDMRFRIPGLELWLSRGGIEISIVPKTPTTPSIVMYRAEGVGEELSPIPSSALTLGWGIDRSFSGNRISKASISTSAALRIEANEPQVLEWFLEQFGKAMTLLSFIAGSPMGTDYLTAKLPDGHHVDVLVALRESKPCEHEDLMSFFMLRGAMQADLGEVSKAWFERFDGVRSPSQLALSVLSSEGLWPHVEFLSLMQALEGFHRAILPGLYMDADEYKTVAGVLAGAIPSSLSPDHRDALKARLKWGNEVSLRKRMAALVARLGLPLQERLLGPARAFPSSWIHTRNYYTHWGEESRVDSLDGREMHLACVRMRLLLRTLYLDFIGIPQEAILKSLDGTSSESQYLIQLNAAEHRKSNPGSSAGVIMSVTPETSEPNDSSAATTD